jgi:hypothetical protein
MKRFELRCSQFAWQKAAVMNCHQCGALCDKYRLLIHGDFRKKSAAKMQRLRSISQNTPVEELEEVFRRAVPGMSLSACHLDADTSVQHIMPQILPQGLPGKVLAEAVEVSH